MNIKKLAQTLSNDEFYDLIAFRMIENAKTECYERDGCFPTPSDYPYEAIRMMHKFDFQDIHERIEELSK